jgi:hypothetical protein
LQVAAKRWPCSLRRSSNGMVSYFLFQITYPPFGFRCFQWGSIISVLPGNTRVIIRNSTAFKAEFQGKLSSWFFPY